MTNPLNINLDPDSIKALQQKSLEIQSKIGSSQQKLTNSVCTGEAGGGMVKITMNGRYEVTNIFIDPAVLKEDPQVISDLLKGAINDTTRQVEKLVQSEMFTVIQSLGLPDFSKEGGDTGGGTGREES